MGVETVEMLPDVRCVKPGTSYIFPGGCRYFKLKEVSRKICVEDHQLVRELERSSLQLRKFQESVKNLCLEISRGILPISRRTYQFLSLYWVDKRTASEKVNCSFVHAFSGPRGEA